jgi:predicted flavoprotein YhiN
VPLKSPRPVAEAISTAGGVCFEGLTPGLMISQRPGVYCAGEMLDWEAPTGGYLLTACLASGWRVGQGVLSNF